MRFIERQPMAVIGSLDNNARVWASVVFGEPGFLGATDYRTLVLDFKQLPAVHNDPLSHNLGDNPNVGLIIIDLGSRRRLRVNGRARMLSHDPYAIDVGGAYPNCPKYIQRYRQFEIEAWNLQDYSPFNPTPQGD